jgi:hypothetical protein
MRKPNTTQGTSSPPHSMPRCPTSALHGSAADGPQRRNSFGMLLMDLVPGRRPTETPTLPKGRRQPHRGMVDLREMQLVSTLGGTSGHPPWITLLPPLVFQEAKGRDDSESKRERDKEERGGRGKPGQAPAACSRCCLRRNETCVSLMRLDR